MSTYVKQTFHGLYLFFHMTVAFSERLPENSSGHLVEISDEAQDKAQECRSSEVL